jgi:dUTP pyrophosphatase
MDKKRLRIQIEDRELIPQYGSALAAGADIRAANREPITLLPGTSALIPTGLKMEIPDGYEVQIRPRSGLALKEQVTVLNTPGTIDADYRGLIGVILINHGKQSFTVTYGMRIAQLVLSPICQAEFVVMEETLASTARGEGGFGHTGMY